MQIDLDASRIGLRYPMEVGLVGQCWDVLRALLPLLDKKSDRRFLEFTQDKVRQWNELMEERGTRMDRPLKPQVVRAGAESVCPPGGRMRSVSVTPAGLAGRVARHPRCERGNEISVSATSHRWVTAPPTVRSRRGRLQPGGLLCAAGAAPCNGRIHSCWWSALALRSGRLKNDLLGMIKWRRWQIEGNHNGVELQPIDFALFCQSCGAG